MGPHSVLPQSAGYVSALRRVRGDTAEALATAPKCAAAPTPTLSMPATPRDTALCDSCATRAATTASPSMDSEEAPRSYPSARSAASVLSRLFGTFSSAAVPVAPTPGGNPYSKMAILRSLGAVRRRFTHFCSLEANRCTRSWTKNMSLPTNPPSGTVSMAPSSSGKEYSTTLCRPAIPSRVHDAISWMRRGAATMYGTFFDDSMPFAMSACRPPSIVPAGPPTRGKPMVDTTASTAAASRRREPRCCLPAAMAACSLALVS
mmetsp:Transcript_3910/g.11350  ORF Transcript_3910/g.11350 Transcript_3910/m.11350 type:complete len:262 (-) Transcript_3910:1732-2517(-)